MIRMSAVWATVVFVLLVCWTVSEPSRAQTRYSSESAQASAGRTRANSFGDRIAPPNPKLVKLPFSFPAGMENTPVVFNGRPFLVDNHRPGGFKAKVEVDLEDVREP